MKKIITLALFAALIMQSCTNVDEVVYDKYVATDFYSSPTGADVALANVYAQIPGNWGGVGYAGADNGWYDVNSMSTDEQVVPHRTTGDWELTFAQMYLREWLPDHSQITNTWNWLYKSVFSANLAVDLLEKAKADPSKIAEAHVLRDFFYYLLIDDFGNVPFFTDNNITVDKMPQKSRAEIFNYILTDLKDNIDKLSTVRGGTYYGRFNKWAGYALLAKLYLNAGVYTGTPMWAECISACDVVTSGGFTLHSGALDASNPLGSKYFELFGNVCPDDETILAIYTTVDVVGRNIFTVRSFGGTDGTNLLGYSAWNGSIVPRDYVDKFADNDIRKHQFRYGANPFGPQPAGFINYSLDVANLDNPGAAPNDGARDQKFWPAAPANSGGASNDFPIYRYADIMLMKAECLVRTNDATDAKPLVDAIRVRAGLTGLTANPTLTDIYNERGFELSWEGHRREDMIRFGTFTLAHGLAPAVDDHFKLFPIPTSALNANTKLVQNPGY
ncbi:MAG: RagB/SusD family nutrient uptake outer membrane protein [Paludibacter sp.]|nr:RagB/SusD family nutrient uptake outer membrane protein [Paludibacter sp.]